jgi:hypothetical protein
MDKRHARADEHEVLALVEAVGIEATSVHLIQTILERFRGQVPRATPPKRTTKTG